MTDGHKGVLNLAAIVAIFPWLPSWFRLAGLTEGQADFWTMAALFSVCFVLVAPWFAEVE